MKAHCCFLLLVSLGWTVQGFVSEFSSGGYVEFQRPDPEQALNIILTAPHGGNLKPADLPDRTNGCKQNNKCVWEYACGTTSSSCKVSTVRDWRSEEITRAVAENLEKLTGKRPYVVISMLHRQKADMNREIGQATLNFTAAVEQYDAFHGFITNARKMITAPPNSRGILFDIHSVASHSEKWLELGYCIRSYKLDSGSYTANDSSIANLAHDVCNTDKDCFNQLLYGPNSLGGFLQGQGIKVVPSPQHNTPDSKGYYSGGYIVQTHGALEQTGMDAIQIEIPRHLRLRNTYKNTASKIAIAIQMYVDLYKVY